MNLDPISPPKQLYHGTASRFVNNIRKEGLLKKGRQHVHLSLDLDTAKKVGSRHGVPVILVVDAETMYATGYEFYLSKNGVWLTDNVPVNFITFT